MHEVYKNIYLFENVGLEVLQPQDEAIEKEPK